MIGGEDQITVVPHLDRSLIAADPKPFLGYSDNTNILNWLWSNGVAGFYGGSTQVHLGPGPSVDPCHETSLRAALLTGERIEITDPGISEDVGKPWDDPAALTEFGERVRHRTLGLGRTATISDRTDMGWLYRGAPVDTHRRSLRSEIPTFSTVECSCSRPARN